MSGPRRGVYTTLQQQVTSSIVETIKGESQNTTKAILETLATVNPNLSATASTSTASLTRANIQEELKIQTNAIDRSVVQIIEGAGKELTKAIPSDKNFLFEKMDKEKSSLKAEINACISIGLLSVAKKFTP